MLYFCKPLVNKYSNSNSHVSSYDSPGKCYIIVKLKTLLNNQEEGIKRIYEGGM